MHRKLFISIAGLALLLGLTSCAPAAAPNDAETAVEFDESAVVLDVRTSGEYAQGHLSGSQLLDFTSGELASALPELDPEAKYLVYCRSGNRSGQAIEMMEQAGFTDLTNLGSLEQAEAATGLPIIR